jgi:hypothetical protein
MKSFHRGQILCTASVPARCWIVLVAGVFAAAFLLGDAEPGASAGANEPVVVPQDQTTKSRRHRRTMLSAERLQQAVRLQQEVQEAEEAQDVGPGGLARKAEFETVTLTDGSKVRVKKWGETYLGYDSRPPIYLEGGRSKDRHGQREQVHRSKGRRRRDGVHPSSDDERREQAFPPDGRVQTIVDFGDPSNHLSANCYVRAIALDAEHNHIYWIDADPVAVNGHIRRATLDGRNVETIVSNLERNPFGLAIDHKRGTMYWGVSPYPADRKIQRGRLDGSEIEDVIVGLEGPLGIAIDGDDERIYFADKGGGQKSRLFSAKLDGTDRKLVRDKAGGLQLVVDRANRKLYWMPANGDRIDRSDLDGTNIESPIKLGKGDFLGNADTRGEFWGMDIDSKAGFIYWVDRSYEIVARANLDGSHVEEIVVGMRVHTARNLALDLAHGFLYWTDIYPSAAGPVPRIRQVKIPERLEPTLKKSPPHITQIEPARQVSGEQIRLVGEGFRGATAVTFIGVGTGESVSAKFDVASDDKIDVTVPQFRTQAKEAAITVQTPGGVTVTLPKDSLVMNLLGWFTKFDAWASGQRFAVVLQPIARGVGFERAVVYVAPGGGAASGPEGMNTVFLKNAAGTNTSAMPRSTIYYEPFTMAQTRDLREGTRLIPVPAIRPSFVDALFECPKKNN